MMALVSPFVSPRGEMSEGPSPFLLVRGPRVYAIRDSNPEPSD